MTFGHKTMNAYLSPFMRLNTLRLRSLESTCTNICTNAAIISRKAATPKRITSTTNPIISDLKKNDHTYASEHEANAARKNKKNTCARASGDVASGVVSLVKSARVESISLMAATTAAISSKNTAKSNK